MDDELIYKPESKSLDEVFARLTKLGKPDEGSHDLARDVIVDALLLLATDENREIVYLIIDAYLDIPKFYP